MGYDTSHHPVDVDLITRRLVPYILGMGEIDDLVADVVRISKVRARANAWGIGTSRYMTEHATEFPADLLVWGRPFFITTEGTTEIAAAIDRYLAADPDDVDFIAAEMLDVLDPKLVGLVQPSENDKVLTDVAIGSEARRNMDLLRVAVHNLTSGKPVQLGGADTAPPRELLEREAIWVMTKFAADLRPGWMDRGHVWPSGWSAAAKVRLGDVFEAPHALLGHLRALDLEFFAHNGIVENYMVGAMVPADRVEEFVGALRANEAALINTWGDSSEFAQVSFQKLREAAEDALHRGLAFCEATEIYSGFSGVMN